MTGEYLSPIANHIWQSTLFAAAAGLLALALRKNRAAVRYCVWLAASVKFLIPFSLLVSIGDYLDWPARSVVGNAQFVSILEDFSRPFALPVPPPALATGSPDPAVHVPGMLFWLWLAGVCDGSRLLGARVASDSTCAKSGVAVGSENTQNTHAGTVVA